MAVDTPKMHAPPQRKVWRRRIVLVDESASFQRVFKARLSQMDCDVLVCPDGRSALALIAEQYVDFVCASYYLQDMRGIDLCLDVRRITQDVCKPVILLTSVDDTKLLNQALPAGVTDIFRKSDLDQLFAYIKRFPVAQEPINGRVLYVEDSRVQRAALTEILTERGLTVDGCTSAEDAWVQFQREDYDLVLTDVVLDGPMSGLGLINLIRRLTDDRGDTPVIAITAFPDKTRRAELSNLGVTDHILKPVQADELFVRIRSQLAMRRFAAEIREQRSKRHAEELSQSETRFQTLFANMPLGVAQIELVRDEAGISFDYRFTSVNPAFSIHMGIRSDAILGLPPAEVFGTEHPPLLAALIRIAETGRPAEFERYSERLQRYIRVRGFSTDAGQIAAIFEDVTQWKKAQETIAELAFYDQLTGLPNRYLLVDRIRQTMAGTAREGNYSALMVVNLDNFKNLNDAHGHDVGDLLLKEVAKRLVGCIRNNDTVARLSGDEFVVILLANGSDANNAAAATELVGEKMLAELNRPYELGTVSYHGSASVGATVLKGMEVSAEDLIKQAELAMYRSKDLGRNSLHFFDPAMEAVIKERATLEGDLRTAIVERQFVLHYQAQVTSTGKVIGAEVLVRWHHPTRGMVSPAHFIPLAEQTGLILPLGHWVMATACQQLAAWVGDPVLGELTLAVNVSALQFSLPNFADEVMSLIEGTGAPANRLKLELTESLLLNHTEDIIAKMLTLKARGLGFSMDDFGTGYSSLSYLKRLPLNQLKIDQSFVRDVLSDPSDAAIARTIVALGQSLGLDVIAEGVETQEQRDFLELSGCHAYQGYFFSKPITLEQFEALIRA